MGGNVGIILILQICSLTFHAVVEGAEKYFEIIEDRVEVNQIAISLAQNQPLRGSESSSSNVITEAGVRVETIFNRKRKEVLRLCADAIPIETYGFQFEIGLYRAPRIAKRSFQVIHIETLKKERLELLMINCPRLTHLDLETNKPRNFNDVYYLAEAMDRNSAIVFKRGDFEKMHPLHCITNISFEKLKELSENVTDLTTPYQPGPIFEDLSEQRIAEKIMNYETLKRSVNIYAKFAKLFAAFSICSFLRTSKIHTCRQALETNSPQIKLDIKEYYEEPCHRRLVHFSNGSAELYLSRCPATFNESISKRLRQTTLFYVASIASRRAVILFSRFNMKGEKIQAIKVVHNLDVRVMQQDKARAKLTSIIPIVPVTTAFSSPEIKFNSLKKRINLDRKNYSVRMPLTLASRKRQISRIRERHHEKMRFIHGGGSGIERPVVEFSHIKKNVFVYQKFKDTYTSIDFCGLTIHQRKYLCDEVLSDAEYRLDPNPNLVGPVRPCYRRQIALTSLEAEQLQTEIFSMWTCPPSLNHKDRVYYMGKSNLRDAAILYRDMYVSLKSDKVNAIHPVSLLLNINRYKLATISE